MNTESVPFSGKKDHNYLTIIPREILLLIADYLGDDIYPLDNFILFKSKEWKSLILGKSKYIDVDKVVCINWNYEDEGEEYYRSIYVKLSNALETALYYLNPIHGNPAPILAFMINNVSNMNLLLIQNDLKWNKRICQLFSDTNFHYKKILKILTGNYYIMDEKIQRKVSRKYVVNIFTQVGYNSGSISESY